MRKIGVLLSGCVGLSLALLAMPARAGTSYQGLNVTGSVSSTTPIVLSLVSAGGQTIVTTRLAPSFAPATGATTVRDSLFVRLGTLAAPYGASKVGTNLLQFTNSQSQGIHVWLSPDNVNFREVTMARPDTIQGIVFTGVGLINKNGNISAPAMDVWGLLTLALLMAGGGYLMLRRTRMGETA